MEGERSRMSEEKVLTAKLRLDTKPVVDYIEKVEELIAHLEQATKILKEIANISLKPELGKG